MDGKHYNELVELSQEIYDEATNRLTDYCAATYCGIGNDTMEPPLNDYLFVAEETSAYLLGNALALLEADSREAEIQAFVEKLRQVSAFAEKKMGSDHRPS